ncbi:MAG: LysR family transcriptional regulator [Desulfocurvibacter africanus]
MNTFRIVAALMSFGRAAEATHRTQSAISAQIKALEEEVGAKLFNRHGKGISLTPAGETLLAYTRKIIALHEEARSKVSSDPEPACTISIRMPQSLAEHFLPRIFELHGRRYPRVGFDVSVCASAVLEEELKTGVTDVAFLLADSVSKAGLAVHCLGTASLVFVAGAGSQAASLPIFGWRNLAATRVLVPKHDCAYKMLLEGALRQRDIRPQALVECNSMCLLRGCVAKQQGVALVPDFAVEEGVKRGELVLLPWDGPRFESGILMIRHENAWLSEEARYFLELCEQVVGQWAKDRE